MIALADLAEAEGRALRRAVISTGYGLGLIGAIVLLIAVGSGLLLWACYQYLSALIGPAATALVTGIAALILAGVLAWIVRRTNP